MIGLPDDLLYSREHLWTRIEGSGVTIGITDYAQEELGKLYSVELPDIDTSIEQDEPFGTIESSKAIVELISPVSGDIVSINEDLSDDVGIINSDPYNTGWMIVVEMNNPSELDTLLDSMEYSDFIEDEGDG
jgi:glycine cleavage system H protein